MGWRGRSAAKMQSQREGSVRMTAWLHLTASGRSLRAVKDTFGPVASVLLSASSVARALVRITPSLAFRVSIDKGTVLVSRPLHAIAAAQTTSS